MGISRKIPRAALEQSIPRMSDKIVESSLETKTISGNEHQSCSTASMKHDNGKSMKYRSKISWGKDHGKGASSGRELKSAKYGRNVSKGITAGRQFRIIMSEQISDILWPGAS
jgi:hypothetical protein